MTVPVNAAPGQPFLDFRPRQHQRNLVQALHHGEFCGLRAAPDDHVACAQADVLISKMESLAAGLGDLNTDVWLWFTLDELRQAPSDAGIADTFDHPNTIEIPVRMLAVNPLPTAWETCH